MGSAGERVPRLLHAAALPALGPRIGQAGMWGPWVGLGTKSDFPLSPQLLMETVGSDIRSCPLCQLGFPVGYPDDALIKHIDSHLENSKI